MRLPEPAAPGEPARAAPPADPVADATPVLFTDAEFVVWRVAERDARADPGSRRERCLTFASADAVRRVWAYPPEWRTLSAAALTALSWQR